MHSLNALSNKIHIFVASRMFPQYILKLINTASAIAVIIITTNNDEKDTSLDNKIKYKI